MAEAVRQSYDVDAPAPSGTWEEPGGAAAAAPQLSPRPPVPPSRERPHGASVRPKTYAARVKLPLLPLASVRLSGDHAPDTARADADDAVTAADVRTADAAPRSESELADARAEQQRRWGIVRSVVLDTPRAQSIAVAIAARNAADAAPHKGGSRARFAAAVAMLSDYGSGTPMKSVLMRFRAAKMAYIRKRLTGEWFKYDVEQKQYLCVRGGRRLCCGAR